jgi:hypothetical protein
MDSDISGTIDVHTYIKLKEDKFYTNFIVIIEMNLQKMKKTLLLLLKSELRVVKEF